MKHKYEIVAFMDTWGDLQDDHGHSFHYRYCDLIRLAYHGECVNALVSFLEIPPDWLPKLPEDEEYKVGDIITLEFARE